MIAMPRRSVTRFFIPLIDVLLLLFCVFLLMPMVNEEELVKTTQSTTDLTEVVQSLEKELEGRNQDLSKFEDLRPQLAELEKLLEEVKRLREERKHQVERIAFKVLDIDRDDGALFFYDPFRPDKDKLKIADEKTAHELIELHKREAKGQELYYYFLYPRVESGFPTRQQAKEYGSWFIHVPNSLKRREAVP
jgi:biopolymer transport protein ExbD